MSMATLPRQRCGRLFKIHHGSGAVVIDFLKIHRGSGRFFKNSSRQQ
jgi:hypothetical protein